MNSDRDGGYQDCSISQGGDSRLVDVARSSEQISNVCDLIGIGSTASSGWIYMLLTVRRAKEARCAAHDSEMCQLSDLPQSRDRRGQSLSTRSWVPGGLPAGPGEIFGSCTCMADKIWWRAPDHANFRSADQALHEDSFANSRQRGRWCGHAEDWGCKIMKGRSARSVGVGLDTEYAIGHSSEDQQRGLVAHSLIMRVPQRDCRKVCGFSLWGEILARS